MQDSQWFLLQSKEVRGAYLQDMHIFNGHPEMLMRLEADRRNCQRRFVRPKGQASCLQAYQYQPIYPYHCLEGVSFINCSGIIEKSNSSEYKLMLSGHISIQIIIHIPGIIQDFELEGILKSHQNIGQQLFQYPAGYGHSVVRLST